MAAVNPIMPTRKAIIELFCVFYNKKRKVNAILRLLYSQKNYKTSGGTVFLIAMKEK